MTSEQPSLPLPAAKPRQADAGQIAAILAALDGSGWLNQKELTARTGISARMIRLWAEQCGGRLLSHPSKGYHLTHQATPDDYRLARRQLASRIRHLANRLRQSDIAWHSHPTQPQS